MFFPFFVFLLWTCYEMPKNVIPAQAGIQKHNKISIFGLPGRAGQ